MSTPGRQVIPGHNPLETLDVVLALHDPHEDYWPYTAATVTSVCTYSSVPLRLHLLHDSTLSETARSSLVRISAIYEHDLAFHHVELPRSLRDVNFRQFSPAAAFRLVIPQLFRSQERVIYLDSDIIFNQVDLADLVNQVLLASDRQAIAAVRDPFVGANAATLAELDYIGVAEADYFNSGVLVFHPRMIRNDLLEEFVQFVQNFPKAVHLDQDLLNVVFRDRVQYLPEAYNYQVKLAKDRLFEPISNFENKVLHYAGRFKPLGGTFSPPDLFFWRHTQHIANLTHYLQQPARYIQKVHTGPGHAVLLPVIPSRT